MMMIVMLMTTVAMGNLLPVFESIWSRFCLFLDALASLELVMAVSHSKLDVGPCKCILLGNNSSKNTSRWDRFIFIW